MFFMFFKKKNTPVFLFECNNTRDVNQYLNGECPYRHNRIDYYITTSGPDGYEKVMSVDMKTTYAKPSRKVERLRKKAIKCAMRRNTGCNITVLPLDPREEVPVMERINEAVRYHQCMTRR